MDDGARSGVEHDEARPGVLAGALEERRKAHREEEREPRAFAGGAAFVALLAAWAVAEQVAPAEPADGTIALLAGGVVAVAAAAAGAAWAIRRSPAGRELLAAFAPAGLGVYLLLQSAGRWDGLWPALLTVGGVGFLAAGVLGFHRLLRRRRPPVGPLTLDALRDVSFAELERWRDELEAGRASAPEDNEELIAMLTALPRWTRRGDAQRLGDLSERRLRWVARALQRHGAWPPSAGAPTRDPVPTDRR